MANTASLTPADYIKKTIGNTLFLYYTFLNHYHLRPINLEDMIDGVLFIGAQQYSEKRQLEEWKSKQ